MNLHLIPKHIDKHFSTEIQDLTNLCGAEVDITFSTFLKFILQEVFLNIKDKSLVGYMSWRNSHIVMSLQKQICNVYSPDIYICKL